MEQRRKFIKKVGLLAGAFSANSLFNELHAASWEKAASKIVGASPEQAATDEDYWSVIQQSYTVNSNLIILNNGGVSPSPRIVQEADPYWGKVLAS